MRQGDSTAFSIRIVASFKDTKAPGSRILNVNYGPGAPRDGGIFVNAGLEVRDGNGKALDGQGQVKLELRPDKMYSITVASAGGELDVYQDGKLISSWTLPGFDWRSITRITDGSPALVLFNDCGDVTSSTSCSASTQCKQSLGGSLHSIQLFNRRLDAGEVSGLEQCAAQHAILGSDAGCYGGQTLGIRNVTSSRASQANNRFGVFCDPQTDGGGWMLMLAYTHQAGGDRPLMAGKLPLSPTGYSHATVKDVLPKIQSTDVAAVRFKCTSQNHRRTVHFTSTSTNIISDAIDGTQKATVSDWKASTPLDDHTGILPARTNAASNGKSGGFTALPFYSQAATGSYHWTIQNKDSNSPARFECDDPQGNGFNTHHEVRTLPPIYFVKH